MYPITVDESCSLTGLIEQANYHTNSVEATLRVLSHRFDEPEAAMFQGLADLLHHARALQDAAHEKATVAARKPKAVTA